MILYHTWYFGIVYNMIYDARRNTAAIIILLLYGRICWPSFTYTTGRQQVCRVVNQPVIPVVYALV